MWRNKSTTRIIITSSYFYPLPVYFDVKWKYLFPKYSKFQPIVRNQVKVRDYNFIFIAWYFTWFHEAFFALFRFILNPFVTHKMIQWNQTMRITWERENERGKIIEKGKQERKK